VTIAIAHLTSLRGLNNKFLQPPSYIENGEIFKPSPITGSLDLNYRKKMIKTYN
jgi:hypothetical protein